MIYEKKTEVIQLVFVFDSLKKKGIAANLLSAQLQWIQNISLENVIEI